MNQIVWKSAVHSINWEKTRRSFKIESSGRRMPAERQATKSFGFLKPHCTAWKGSNLNMQLVNNNLLRELLKALRDTSSGKAIRKAERTAQRFSRRKLNPRVPGKRSSEKKNQASHNNHNLAPGKASVNLGEWELFVTE
ncbi:hypothetical protein D1164_12130 [Mariniphaga sediminis]|uniref:Uncharacterized protein n=1 Tax=Mariniphaga sediminis TaxID=1628158 RepID=A0A399CZD6_9BACT|nr:hypothetical protein [Mariniphaga sediminis]RIH64789.1 hypothetical protein D1164_12130 [Mariniphaga sediminis]